MTPSDALSRLRAGLAEDELIAQAAAGERWPEAMDTNDVREARFAFGEEGFAHAVRQNPKTELRRAEATRKVRDLIQDVDADIADEIIAALASIYPDDETEGLTR